MGKYEQIIEWVFFNNYTESSTRVPFDRADLVKASEALGLERIKNLGDIPYSFRFRREMPKKIQDTAPKSSEWIIVGAGTATYQFRLAAPSE